MTRFRILIADDDVTQHEVLGDYLERSGFEVIHAYDGRQAVETADKEPLDLVCLDIRMPGMDGFAVLEALHRRWPNLPVLFLSSLDAAHVKVRGLELGADDYIVKPFQKAEVLARVRAALRRSAKYRHLQETMSGDLAQMSVAEILQAFELGRKSAKIVLEAGPGEIALSEGLLVSAAWRGMSGNEALQRMLLTESGGFAIEFTERKQERGQSVNAVLMDALVAQDEALSIIEKVGGIDESFRVSASLSEFLTPWNETMTLRQILLALPGDLREAAERIVSWYEQGLIEPGPSSQGEGK